MRLVSDARQTDGCRKPFQPPRPLDSGRPAVYGWRMASAAFEALEAAHYGAALARQYALSDLLGDHEWHLDVPAGTIDFGQGRVYPVQLLGTEAEEPGTWLWAWANRQSDLPAHVLEAGLRLRAHGERHGVPELAEPEVPLSEIDGHRLAAVAVGLCGADACYRGPYRGGAVFLLLNGTPLAGPLRSPPVRMLTVVTEIAARGFPNPRGAIEAYLAGESATFERIGDDRIDVAGGALRLRFDASGRLIQASGRQGPERESAAGEA